MVYKQPAVLLGQRAVMSAQANSPADIEKAAGLAGQAGLRADADQPVRRREGTLITAIYRERYFIGVLFSFQRNGGGHTICACRGLGHDNKPCS